MRKAALAASAAFVIASGAMAMPASAADLDFFEPAPPPFVPTWQGFYFGGHVGYGEARVRTRAEIDVFGPNEFAESFALSRTLRPDGLLGGVQAGYNWQADSLVFGIEGDISFTDWRRRSVLFDTDAGDFGGPFGDDFAVGTVSADVDFLASIRGRIGFAADNLLIYGTGGIAWADATARARLIADFDGFGVDEDISLRRSLSDVGFVLGGGASWMVIPQTFSVGVEGLFYFFDKRRTLLDGSFEVGGGDVPRFEVDARVTARLDDAWVIRLRGDLHF